MKNIKKGLILLIITIFLIPSIANASSTEIEEYYYIDHDEIEEWETDPDDMCDANLSTWARTTNSYDSQLLTENQYTSTHPMGDIIRAYIQTMAFGETGSEGIHLTPVYDGDNEGETSTWTGGGEFPTMNGVWSPKFDIEHTGHIPWQWEDTGTTDLRVEPKIGSPSQAVSCTDNLICVEYE